MLFNIRNVKIIYLTDTLKLTDTVFRKYERVVPKKIYIYKTDTLRVKKEVIRTAEMKKDELTIITQNEKDSTIKKYDFSNIYRDFTLQPDSGGIKLYRKNSGWEGLKIKAGLSNINFPDSMKSKIYTGIETGIYYKRLSINTGIYYYPVINKYGFDINVSFLIR
jgi:hypothetical protein